VAEHLRYAAFLRGMNLGKRRITNEELCARFGELGLREATAFLASGNVVFETDEGDEEALARRIEDGLRESLGYEVPIFLRSGEEVHAIVGRDPFSAAELERSAGKVQVALLGGEPAAEERDRVLDLAPAADRLAFFGRELHWLPAAGVSDSELDWKAVDRILGTVTLRTRRTFERIAVKFF